MSYRSTTVSWTRTNFTQLILAVIPIPSSLSLLLLFLFLPPANSLFLVQDVPTPEVLIDHANDFIVSIAPSFYEQYTNISYELHYTFNGSSNETVVRCRPYPRTVGKEGEGEEMSGDGRAEGDEGMRGSCCSIFF